VGWSVGFTKIFFTILAGFLAAFISSKYSYREGLSLYLTFVVVAVLTIVLGCFIVRLVDFLCMNFLDKIGGLVLSVCVWLILCTNVIVPIMVYENYVLDKSSGKICRTVSCFIESKVPLFKGYVFSYAHLKSKLQNFNKDKAD
jgi:Ca2+/H+ antiporter